MHTAVSNCITNNSIYTRIDHGMKTEFTHVCEEIGLSPSQAIKLFAKAVINYGGTPSELKSKQPNKITIQAMQELEEGKGHRASSTSDLFTGLQVKVENARNHIFKPVHEGL